MRLLTCTAIAAALVMSTAACTQQESPTGNEVASAEVVGDLTALNGTWKTDRDSVKFEQKPDEFSLKDGTYNCTTCIPPLTVAADGQFHDVTGRPYADSISVKAADDKTIEIHSKKGGKEVSSLTMSASADGNTLTRKFHDATVKSADRRIEHFFACRSCARWRARGIGPMDPEPGKRIFGGRAECHVHGRGQ